MTKKKSDTPDNESDNSLYARLLVERDELLKKKKAREGKAGGYIGEIGFHGVVGGIALLADWAMTGGIFTIFATANGLGYLNNASERRKVEKEIKALDEKILRIEESPAFQAMLQAKLADQSMKKDFDKAIKKVEELTREVADLKNKEDPKRNIIRKPDLFKD